MYDRPNVKAHSQWYVETEEANSATYLADINDIHIANSLQLSLNIMSDNSLVTFLVEKCRTTIRYFYPVSQLIKRYNTP